MAVEQHLRTFGNIPFSHGAVLPLLAGYRCPNDKISSWLATGELVQLRRGLYLLGDAHRQGPVSKSLLANLLYGPSYVSLESALGWHGLIPEGVMEVSSVTLRRARTLYTPLGVFSYTHLPWAFYAIGIVIESNQDGSSYLLASPEKAVCDKVALTRRLSATSVKAMRAFLFEDLRMEPEAVAMFDTSIVQQCMETGYKTRQITALYKVIRDLQ